MLRTVWNNGGKSVAISVALLTAAILLLRWDARRHFAQDAILDAIDRMEEVVEQDNPATLMIACGNTTDPISCVTDGDGSFTISYFRGPDSNRTLFATRKVRVDKKPRFIYENTVYQ
jgi:hypothetical protein